MTGRLGELWVLSPLAFWLVAAACAYFVLIAVRLTVIDVQHHLLPNRIVLPAYGVGGGLLLGATLIAAPSSAAIPVGALPGVNWVAAAGPEMFRILVGGALLWCFYFVLRFAYPAGMGFGDVKLAGVLGLYLGYVGWLHLFAGVLFAFLLGGLWSAGLLLTRRGTLKSAIPFGPFMLLGAAGAMLLPP